MKRRVELVEELIELITKNDRVCPKPQKWNGLYKQISIPNNTEIKWYAPLILATWYETTDMEKRQRLNEQIEWAERHGKLELMSTFLKSLEEEDWEHQSDGSLMPQ